MLPCAGRGGCRLRSGLRGWGGWLATSRKGLHRRGEVGEGAHRVFGLLGLQAVSDTDSLLHGGKVAMWLLWVEISSLLRYWTRRDELPCWDDAVESSAILTLVSTAKDLYFCG